MKFVEYWIHYDLDDTRYVPGREWQRVRKLVAHPTADIHSIERVEQTFDRYGDLLDNEYKTIYERI